MTGWHSIVRLVLAIARVGKNVGRSDHARAVKSRSEHRCITRHWELGERFARRSRKCMERVSFPIWSDHIVKERPEFGTAKFYAGVSNNLNELLQVQFTSDRDARTVENFEGVSFFPQLPDARLKRLVGCEQAS